MSGVARCIFGMLFTVLWFGAATAQNVGVIQSDILVLDTESLMAETLLGKRLTEDFQKEREDLIARNRKLEAELEAEEQDLTELRAEKSPEEFSKLADAFDEKVQSIRQNSERTARDLERRRELAPVQFMRLVEPVLAQMMRDSNAVVVLDTRSVLLRAAVIDITDMAVQRINEEVGDGRTEAPGDTPATSTTDE